MNNTRRPRKTEAERRANHERKFGKGSPPPKRQYKNRKK